MSIEKDKLRHIGGLGLHIANGVYTAHEQGLVISANQGVVGFSAQHNMPNLMTRKCIDCLNMTMNILTPCSN